jgi:maltose alpha-D-glucosyltransferase/alpha-amylase
MLRSFHYAAYASLFREIERGSVEASDVPRMEKWADNWNLWVGAAFLGSYLEVAGDAECLPRSREDLQVLFDTYLMEKAVYELIYELNNRPDWVRIPLEGIEALAG